MIIHIILQEIIQVLKSEGAYKIILLGSYAYGNPDDQSDLDILVISPEDFIPATNHDKMELHHRYNSGIKKFRELIPIDLMVYTKAMYDRLMVSPNLFFSEINQKGKILYERIDQRLA
jgi:uncharacterized protein